MMEIGFAHALMICAAALAAGYAVTGLVIPPLRRRAILDRPNERSSHTTPVPRGGGWGIMSPILPAWAVIALVAGDIGTMAPVLAGALLLVGVSWFDDLRGLTPALRLAAQIVAVGLAVLALPDGVLVFQGLLPPVADRLAAALAWLWFINLFNFMDGIDGLAGTEAASIGAGVVLVTAIAGLAPQLGLYAAVVAGAALGFLVWNWQPAKVFMGDVGSVPLGYVLGWLLVVLAVGGLLPAAILLPLYFVADATITLTRRVWRRERVWRAHREHFYQRAVRQGHSHARVVMMVGLVNVLLIVLAVASLLLGWIMLTVGAAAVGGLLWLLTRPSWVAPMAPPEAPPEAP
jgi:UDP-N-acetylmuramyl pentapeptide phosphotransferase/UDP-N-acetylglucosamine-1-phosphate transferase